VVDSGGTAAATLVQNPTRLKSHCRRSALLGSGMTRANPRRAASGLSMDYDEPAAALGCAVAVRADGGLVSDLARILPCQLTEY
jgi:hypothetical protein